MRSLTSYALFLLATSLFAQETPGTNASPVVIGSEWKMHSAVLDEDRTISVHLPDDYAQGTLRYPVLYALDGEQEFVPLVGASEILPWARRGPDLIVVAIHNTHRTHDLTTPWTSKAPAGQAQWMVNKAGGADPFLAFLKTELLPEIDRRYRTTPFRILLGHSLGGLFVLHAFDTSPDLFRSWIALSPPAFWNGDEPINGSVQLFVAHPNLNTTLFISRAAHEFDDTPRAFDKMNEALRLRAPSSLKWQTKIIEGADHGTSLLAAAQAGLEFTFLDWRLPQLVFDEGLDSIEQYYRGLSERYGFEVKIPEGEIAALAGGATIPQPALRIYERYNQLYPQSLSAVAGLAEALDSAGEVMRANDAYTRAISLAIQTNDPRADNLKKRQASLTARTQTH